MIVKTAALRGVDFLHADFISHDKKFCHFVCKCGKEFRILNDKVYSNGLIKCSDCKKALRAKPHRDERLVLRRIKGDAYTRGLPFDISIEWFKEVCHSPCVYCGSVDSNRGGAEFTDGFGYNGLDRIDNSLGYFEGNCLPCCWTCNRAKWNMSREDFLKWRDSMVEWTTGGGHK